MKIYVTHSRSFDFKQDLYEPLRNSKLGSDNELILPHESSEDMFDSKSLFESGTCDFVLVEGSFKSLAVGIELGWANMCKIPIVCVYKRGSKISAGLNTVCEDFIEYENSSDLIEKVDKLLFKKN